MSFNTAVFVFAQLAIMSASDSAGDNCSDGVHASEGDLVGSGLLQLNEFHKGSEETRGFFANQQMFSSVGDSESDELLPTEVDPGDDDIVGSDFMDEIDPVDDIMGSELMDEIDPVDDAKLYGMETLEGRMGTGSEVTSKGTSATECNWQCYMDRYPLVGKICKYQEKCAKEYFEIRRAGKKRGHDCTCHPTGFDSKCNWRCYLDRYPALKKRLNNSLPLAKMHYDQFGYKEKRDCVCWEVIAKQDSSKMLFNNAAKSTFLMNENDANAAAFMKIGNLDKDSYKKGGKYHFKLVYDGGEPIEWEQSSWLTSNKIEGLQCLSPSDCGPSWKSTCPPTRFTGLGKSEDSQSVLDGSGDADCLGIYQDAQSWNTVGTIKAWNGRMLAYKQSTATTMELFAETPAEPSKKAYVYVGVDVAGPEKWGVDKGKKGLGVASCYTAAIADPDCVGYFTYVARGDQNCGCATSGAMKTRPEPRADYYHIIRIDCSHFMTTDGCAWTANYNCPGQMKGALGRAGNDGSLGWECCCAQELWTATTTTTKASE